MRLVVTEFLSLDGVMENPAWTMPYWGDDIAAYKGDEQSASDAMLLGRKTYEGFAQAWPESTEEGADEFNNMKKYVVTATLTELTWTNSEAVTGDLVAAITALKAKPGRDLVVHGSGTLAAFLLEHDLVDELKLLVYPVTVGAGQRLFPDGLGKNYALTSATPFASGVVALIYHPAPAGDQAAAPGAP